MPLSRSAAISMASFKKSSSLSHQCSYRSLYVNPLDEVKNSRSRNGVGSFGLRICRKRAVSILGKENVSPAWDAPSSMKEKPRSERKPCSSASIQSGILKPSSLQLCMQMSDPNGAIGSSLLEDRKSNAENAWDHSDSEAAPASSWFTLPNRALLFRPLPLDIGRCSCFIVKETSQELKGASLYSLCTNEGRGRQNRKLAVALHRRHSGRSEFLIAQNIKGILCKSDESFLGFIKANIMGSKYRIWGQGSLLDFPKKKSHFLLAVVMFTPTITTLTGNFRSMRAWIPKYQSMQLKNATQIQHIHGLPENWEEKVNNTHQLFSKVPLYNNISKQYELDFRERGKAPGPRIKSSVKNFQLVMEEKGKQSILQLGKTRKFVYVMDYRFPMTAYQAFSICLASIDSKLCCSV